MDPAYDLLGISPREIGDYTPGEIDRMMTIALRRWQRDQSLADLRAARICSVLTSTKDAPHPPREFMIDYETGNPPKEPKRQQTPEEMIAILRAIAIQNGGTVK